MALQGTRVAVEALAAALEAMEHDCLLAAKQFRGAAAACEAWTSALMVAEKSGAPRRSVMLASASRARRAIVASLLPEGFELCEEFLSPDIDEKAIRRSDPREMVLAIAHAKADKAVEVLSRRRGSPMPDIIVCADQVVLFGNEVREKPVDRAQAKAHMRSYGTEKLPARCLTAVVVITGPDFSTRIDGVDEAVQHFEEIPDLVCEALLDKGDVMSSAGSFVVEDPLVAPFLGSREGELSSIRGLPGALTRRLLVSAAESLDEARKRSRAV